jgi:putative polyhydroxyalkanoate system protein
VPDIRIHREHRLGLAKARKIAWKWAEEVEQQFGMDCSVLEGETSDTVEFTRSGVNGRLIVAADHFDLDAKLGFLLGAFSRTIEAQIEKNLDELLAGETAGTSAAAKAPKAHAIAKAAAAPSGRASGRPTDRAAAKARSAKAAKGGASR